MNTLDIRGYQIKNHICDTHSFQLYDAIDPKGHSCVLKRLNGNHNYIVYKDQDYQNEGNDYFNYDNGETNAKNNNNNKDSSPQQLTFITPRQSPNYIKQHDIKYSIAKNKYHLLPCQNRIKTPMPYDMIDQQQNNNNNNTILPDSPNSNYSIESSDTNNTINNDLDDTDYDSDDLDDCIISHENCNLKPILNNDNENNNIIPHAKDQTMSTSHIHIQTPRLLINHQQHNKHIRKTPIPKDCWFNRNESTKLWENHFINNSQEKPHHSKLNQSWNNDNFINSTTTTNSSTSDNKFELKMIQSSMLKRRSLPKCEPTK